MRRALQEASGSSHPLLALEEATGRPPGDGHALGSPLAAIVIAATAPSLHAALRGAVMLGAIPTPPPPWPAPFGLGLMGSGASQKH